MKTALHRITFNACMIALFVAALAIVYGLIGA